MEETKHDKFVRIRDLRLPKALKSIELLANLASHNYESSVDEQGEILDELRSQVDQVAEAFGFEQPVPEPEPEPEPELELAPDVPQEVITQNAGPYTRGWAAWALDKLQMGQIDEAKAFLKRALEGDKYA